eukprot:NODE_223_length_12360_cov_0.266862.p7 type:complete len:136 gc:universal NODE_223_length_12360_cov_0.266862:5489-5082(-)
MLSFCWKVSPNCIASPSLISAQSESLPIGDNLIVLINVPDELPASLIYTLEFLKMMYACFLLITLELNIISDLLPFLPIAFSSLSCNLNDFVPRYLFAWGINKMSRSILKPHKILIQQNYLVNCSQSANIIWLKS